MPRSKTSKKGIKILELENSLLSAGHHFERKIEKNCYGLIYTFNKGTTQPFTMIAFPLFGFSKDDETIKESVYCTDFIINSFLTGAGTLGTFEIRKSICEQYELKSPNKKYEEVKMYGHSIEGIINTISRIKSALPDLGVRIRREASLLERFHIEYK